MLKTEVEIIKEPLTQDKVIECVDEYLKSKEYQKISYVRNKVLKIPENILKKTLPNVYNRSKSDVK